MDLSVLHRLDSYQNDLSKLGIKSGRRSSSEAGDTQRLQAARSEPRIVRSAKDHYEDLWGCITRNIGKGFVVGYLGKALINSLYPIMALMRGRKIKLSKQMFVEGSREYGLFFGSILGTYNGLMYSSKNFTSVAGRYRAFFAGAIAGTSLAWVPKNKRWPIVLFMLVRAFELQVKMAVNRGFLPNFVHGDTLLMCLSSASMIHNWLLNPTSLDRTYASFLTKQSQMPLAVRQAVPRMHTGQPLDLESLNKLRGALPPLTNPLGYDSWSGGEVIHPGQSFLAYALKFFYNGLKFALPVYIPVFCIPVLIFYPGSLIKAPLATIKRVLLGVARSSTFLSLYCTMAICSLSLMRSMGITYKNLGSPAHWALAMCGFMGGTANLVEKKSRRIELALYVMSKAVEGRWNLAVMSKLIKATEWGEIAVFAYSFGVLVHCYTRHGSMLRGTYRSLLCKFLDTDKRHKFYQMPRILSRLAINENISQPNSAGTDKSENYSPR